MAILKKLTGLALALAAPALAQIEMGVVQVDASPLGEDYVTADVFIDVAQRLGTARAGRRRPGCSLRRLAQTAGSKTARAAG